MDASILSQKKENKKEEANSMKKNELIAKVKSLGLSDKGQRNSVICSIIGHSKIISISFSYVYCARCGEQIGDRLAGVYNTTKKVIVGHNCEICRKNYEALTWEDKLYVKNPFKTK